MNQTNGHPPNGHQSNGKQMNGREESSGTSGIKTKEGGWRESLTSNFLSPKPHHEQAVVLKQSPTWSRAIIWTLMGVTTASVIWAAFATIEQVVPAQGQLKPQGTVKKIQAPINGVVKEVFVEDGESVKAGDLLVTMDSEASKADLASLKKIYRSLQQENQFYRSLMDNPLDTAQVETTIGQLKLPREVAALARNRAALIAENKLYQIQLANAIPSNSLDPEQLARVRASQAESRSRAATAKLDYEQLEKQLNQNQVKLTDARKQLITDRMTLEEINSRNQKAVAQAEKSLAIEEKILRDVQPLGEEGAISTLQIEKQRQQVSDRYTALVEKRSNGQVEYDKQQQQLQTRLTEIGQYLEEEQRLRLAIAQGKEKLINATSLTEKDTRDKMADNQKKIAEIDSQLTKALVENEKRLAELDGQISHAQVTLRYQELRAPVSGTVFDLKAGPGFVPEPAQAEALLKIVPDDYLIAEVDITNKDIGFVKEGMPADIRVDSFPFSEFGDVKGAVKEIGSDALPPDETHKYYRFPTKIHLDRQFMIINGDKKPLVSGMSVSANIKVREKRTVLSLFTELFTSKVESLKQVR
jgi:hemolysin D